MLPFLWQKHCARTKHCFILICAVCQWHNSDRQNEVFVNEATAESLDFKNVASALEHAPPVEMKLWQLLLDDLKIVDDMMRDTLTKIELLLGRMMGCVMSEQELINPKKRKEQMTMDESTAKSLVFNNVAIALKNAPQLKTMLQQLLMDNTKITDNRTHDALTRIDQSKEKETLMDNEQQNHWLSTMLPLHLDVPHKPMQSCNSCFWTMQLLQMTG